MGRYEAAVCSLLTYGCETWDLNEKVMRQINGANSVMLARITGRHFREEANYRTTSFNLVQSIRRRRTKWVGEILRNGPDHHIHRALEVQREMALPGNLFMDCPPHRSLDELAEKFVRLNS